MLFDKCIIADVETLDVRGSSILLSLGMVYVDFSDIENITIDSLRNKSLDLKFDAKEQGMINRTVSKSTLEWWEKQSDEAREVLKQSTQDVSILTLNDEINEWISGWDIKNDDDLFWLSRGFMDYNILTDISITNIGCGVDDHPWKFWRQRDIKTLIHTLTEEKRGKIDIDVSLMSELNEHNCVDDCIIDALRLKLIFENLYD